MTTQFARRAFSNSPLGRTLAGIEIGLMYAIPMHLFCLFLFGIGLSPDQSILFQLDVGITIFAFVIGFLFGIGTRQSWLFPRIIKPNRKMIERYKEKRRLDLLEEIANKREGIRYRKKLITQYQNQLIELKTI